MKKKILTAFITLILVMGLLPVSALSAEPTKDTVIYFTNDVHGNITNVRNANGLSYAKLKALKDYTEGQGKDVILVDAGDHSSGTMYASYDYGKSLVEIMDQTGYDIAVPGNHEFDYNAKYFFDVLSKIPTNFSYIACNLYNGSNTEFGSLALEPYKIIDAGGKKIAFVGIMTPETISATAAGYFQDDEGNWKYYISTATAPDEAHNIYECVNSAIQSAKNDGADYVVGVGHLGDEAASKAASVDSASIIANSRGLDAFIDGHSHTIHDGTGEDIITDLDGDGVPLLQAASGISATSTTENSGMNRIGQLTISAEGTISYSILTEADLTSIVSDVAVAAAETAWLDSVDGNLTTEICSNEIAFAPATKAIQRAEANSLGDLVSDSFFYYANTVPDQNGVNWGCDGALFNGGGIRAPLGTGILKTSDFCSVLPFVNSICVLEISGQTLLDALEFGAKETPGAFGGFLHASGITYSIDLSITSTIQLDNGIWTGPPTGEYRVKNVKVYNKTKGVFEKLDLSKTYKIATVNYLANAGDGFAMFGGVNRHENYSPDALSYKVFSYYASKFKNSTTLPTISSANSPIYEIEGCANFPINYEAQTGATRILIGSGIANDNSNNEKKSTATGDDNYAITWIVLAITTATAGAITAVKKRKLAE